MRKRIFILISILVFLICGCNRTDYTIVEGMVYSYNGTPLADIKVTIGEETTKTDSTGHYACPVHARNRWCNAKFQHDDYVAYYIGLSELEKKQNVYLAKREAPYAGESTTDFRFVLKKNKSYSDHDISIEVPANTFIDSNGKPFKGKYNLTIDIVPIDSNFIGISPGGKFIGTMDESLVCTPFNLEIRSTTGEKLSIKEDSYIKLNLGVGSSKPMWRYDESLNCWAADYQTGYTTSYDNINKDIYIRHLGWLYIYVPNEFPNEFRTKIVDRRGRPVPYAELWVETAGFKGNYTATKDGDVLFYYKEEPKVVLKGYHTAVPSNRYPFVDEDEYINLENDRITIINDEQNAIYSLSVNEQNYTKEEVKPEDEDVVFGSKSLMLDRNELTAKPYEDPENEECHLDSSNMMRITLEELGYGCLKRLHGGKYDFWEDAHITRHDSYRTIIKSNNYKHIEAIILSYNAFLCSADTTLYTDTDGETRCRINALYFKPIITGYDGFKITPIYNLSNETLNYSTGVKKSYYIKEPITCKINYNGLYQLTDLLGDKPQKKIDPSFDITISVSLPEKNAQNSWQERNGHKLNIYRLTDGHGKNAFADVQRDCIKKEALLTGELNFEFYGRDSIYNQTVKFRKYNNKDFKTAESNIYNRIIITFCGIIVLISVLVIIDKSKKDVKMAQYKIIAHVLRLNPIFTSRQQELIKNYAGLSDRAIGIIKKNMKYTFDDLDFTLLEEKLDLSKRREFIHLLFKLSAEDDGIKNDEWSLLHSLMVCLGLNKLNIEYMQRRYSPLRSEYNDYSQYYKSTNGRQSTTYANSTTANTSDYAELGLSYGASKEEVQQAYHKLAMEYHPDLPKNANRHNECVRRMAAINVAYKHLVNQTIL